MTSRSPTTVHRPSDPTQPPAASRARRLAGAIWRECQFVFVPRGGWTTRRAVGRVVLGLIALSGTGGLGLVGALVLLKERGHIAAAIRTGIDLIHDRLGSKPPVPPPAPPRRTTRPAPPAPSPTHRGPGSPAPKQPAPVAPPPAAPARRRQKQKVLG